MHEMSVALSMVEICERSAAGRKVASVTVQIGDLSGVAPEAVEFCFEACTQGTLVEGAKLIVERLPALGRCRGCGADYPVKAFYDPCPACASFATDLLSGDELRVKELEVE